MPITFSNPRIKATFPDWPLGGNKRGECRFHLEHKDGRGFRFVRQTTGKPKANTYGGEGAIVDGSDGKTYLIQHRGYSFISVSRSDFMAAESEVLGFDHAVFPDNPVHAELRRLIREANTLFREGVLEPKAVEAV